MEKVVKTDAEWQSMLEPLTYQVTRHAATERPWTGEYLNCKEAGTYHCVCCGTPLFVSDTKFESGCGWPSFFKPLPGVILEHVDTSHGMVRTEVTCVTCDAHLGHVFDDGPAPTGLRYCINSVCLVLQKI